MIPRYGLPVCRRILRIYVTVPCAWCWRRNWVRRAEIDAGAGPPGHYDPALGLGL